MTEEAVDILRRVEPMLLQLVKDVAEIKGRLAEMPTVAQIAALDAKLAIMPQPPEFYELRGRVEEISRRLPTTLAYAPPVQK